MPALGQVSECSEIGIQRILVARSLGRQDAWLVLLTHLIDRSNFRQAPQVLLVALALLRLAAGLLTNLLLLLLLLRCARICVSISMGTEESESKRTGKRARMLLWTLASNALSIQFNRQLTESVAANS